HGRRRLVGAIVATAALAAVISAGIASGAGPTSLGQGRGHGKYTIGLFGDMPYGALGRAQYPNLLADINRSNVALSIAHCDVLAGGDGPCTDSLYTTALANFNSLD